MDKATDFKTPSETGSVSSRSTGGWHKSRQTEHLKKARPAYRDPYTGRFTQKPVINLNEAEESDINSEDEERPPAVPNTFFIPTINDIEEEEKKTDFKRPVGRPKKKRRGPGRPKSITQQDVTTNPQRVPERLICK